MRWWLALVLAVGVQLIVLYSPGSAVPSVGIPGFDKVIHLAIFMAPAFVVRRLAQVGWPIWLLSVHAVASEGIQHWLVANRTGDWRDVLVNLVGVMLGMLLAGWWARRPLRRADAPVEMPA